VYRLGKGRQSSGPNIQYSIITVISTNSAAADDDDNNDSNN
jgi:hypothetical protein